LNRNHHESYTARDIDVVAFLSAASAALSDFTFSDTVADADSRVEESLAAATLI
jgi:hypothetical protein